MTTFAPHRETLECFVDCIHGGADTDVLAGLLAEDVVMYSPLGDEPISGREAVIQAIQAVNALADVDSYDAAQPCRCARHAALEPAHGRGVTIWWFPEPLSHNTIGGAQAEVDIMSLIGKAKCSLPPGD